MKVASLFFLTIFLFINSAFAVRVERPAQNENPLFDEEAPRSSKIPCDTTVTYTISPEGDTTRTYTVSQYRGSQAIAQSIDNGVYHILLYETAVIVGTIVALLIFQK